MALLTLVATHTSPATVLGLEKRNRAERLQAIFISYDFQNLPEKGLVHLLTTVEAIHGSWMLQFRHLNWTVLYQYDSVDRCLVGIKFTTLIAVLYYTILCSLKLE